MQTIFKEIKLPECFHLHVLTINIMRRSDIDPDCVSVRIDNSAASANSLLCKIMLAVKSVLNCGGRESERERESGDFLLFSVLSESSVQTCCSVESEPSSSDSYP